MAEGIPQALQAEAERDGDPFRHAEPFPGLESFGRSIVDALGAPSGSPANYEALRGSTGETAAAQTDMDPAAVAEQIASDFAAMQEPGEQPQEPIVGPHV